MDNDLNINLLPVDNNTIGSFVGLGNKDEMIYPEDIPGYISPGPQKLESDGEKLVFVYDPIKYSINYDLDNGEFNSEDSDKVKNKYTIEESYNPPIPKKDGFIFNGWNPANIARGTMGNMKFTALWKPYPTTPNGKELNRILKLLGKATVKDCEDEDMSEKIISIQKATELPESNSDITPENISTTENPIFVWVVPNANCICVFTENPIMCDVDMTEAFSGFKYLRDISALSDWILKDDTDISNIFDGCGLLSDTSPLDHWKDTKFNSIKDAFKGTSALETNRVPSWYRWNVSIYITSTVSGDHIDIVNDKYIPGQTVYLKNYNGYTLDKASIDITKDGEKFIINASPVEYSIIYNTNGGLFVGGKQKYTVEDIDYYPPDVMSVNPPFDHWEPRFIPKGSTGNIAFNAVFKTQ
jgi:hypothetical protein